MVGRLIRNRAAVGTIGLVLIVALIGIFAPFIAPNDPYAPDILNKFAGFSQQYPLGTDNLGRCILSRMIYGIRPTLGLAVLTMLGTIGLGALMGLLAGYFRGIVEEVIMRTVDVMLSFPSQIMVFAVVALLGISVQNVILANVFIKWAWYARMIRTGVMQYRDRNFVRFSRCIGTPESFILFRHLVPSIAADLAVLSSLDVGWGDYQYFNPLISGTGCTGTDTGMGSDAERGEECPHQQSGTDAGSGNCGGNSGSSV